MKFLVRLIGIVAEAQVEIEGEDNNAVAQAAMLMLQQGNLQLNDVKPYVLPLIMPVTDVAIENPVVDTNTGPEEIQAPAKE